jgi:hypothetical protein
VIVQKYGFSFKIGDAGNNFWGWSIGYYEEAIKL